MGPSDELYQSLETAYIYFNSELFNGELPDVIFTVQRQKGVMGYFAPERWGEKGGRRCHEIAINPSYLARSRLFEIMQTLVHEMAHCWQYSFGKPGRRYYHNRQWAYKMIDIGLMPSSTGAPGGNITGQVMSDYIVEGGPFHRACLSLLGEQGFELKWADRKAMPRMFDPQIIPASTISQSTSASSVETAIGDKNLVPVTTAEGTTYPISSHEKLSKPWLDEPVEDFFIDAVVHKQKRVKYVCPTCDVKLYGKSKLNIRCDDCNKTFIEIIA